MKIPICLLAQSLLVALFGAAWSPSEADQSAGTNANSTTAANYSSRLWRIEGTQQGDALSVSWLFGTVHVENAEVLALFDPLVSLLDETDRLILEVNTEGLTRRDYDSHMLLPEGQSLERIIGPSLFHRTLDAGAQNGLTRPRLDRYRPFAPILMLASPPRKTGLYLDEKIRRLAISRGKTIVGLETLQQQMNILGGMSVEDQISLLSYTIDTQHELDDDIQVLIDEYLRGEIGALLEQSRQQMDHPDTDLAQRLEDRLLNDRNKTMVQRLMPMLAEKSNFIAIGAAHLPGPNGVIELLRQRGYRVVAKPTP